MWNITKLCIVLIMIKLCEAANILYVIPYGVKSHYIMQRPIGLELARRGHNVTVITANREKHHPPNYHQIMVDDVYFWDVLGEQRPNLLHFSDLSEFSFLQVVWKSGMIITENALKSNAVQTFLAQNNTFDVVISVNFYQEATNMLAHKYQAPLILLSTVSNSAIYKVLTGNPLELAIVPHEFLLSEDSTSFLARFKNLCVTSYEYFWWKYWFLRKQETIARTYIPNLPEPVPNLYEIQKYTALFLMNSHFSLHSPMSLPPNIVEIGGLHLSERNDELPKDLLNILDGASNGVIYMSFGSNIRTSDMDIDKLKAFKNVFRKINCTVLWKWDADVFENKPSNVVIKKWFPQKDILAHPNTKVFISHGGAMGTSEAIFNGVPVIGIPVYGDQYRNIQKIEEAGLGVKLAYSDLNEKSFENVLNKVLKSNFYSRNAKEQARVFKDRPMKPLDTAVFWIEYVIRNKGVRFIKNPSTKLNWIGLSMLDVYTSILFLIFVLAYIFYKTVTVVISFLMHLKKTITKRQMNAASKLKAKHL